MTQPQPRPQGKEQDTLPVNDYDFWDRALAGEEVGGSTLPIHEGEAHSGFWRRRSRKGGPFLPVAIWRENGVCCLVDGKPADASEQWSYCCRFPISEAHYRERIATGKWFDEDDAVTESLSPPPAGHNSGNELETFRDQIDSALNGVAGYTNIKDDATAAKAQSLRSRLLELSGDVDKAREKLVRPHLDAQSAFNADYMPLIKGAKAGADVIRQALKDHENRKDKEARVQAAAEAQRLAQEAFKHASLGSEPPMPEPAPVAAPAPLKGSYGRAATVRMVKKGTITDLQAVFTYFREQPDVVEFFAKKVQKAVDAGFTPAGVEITEERDVR